MRWSFLIIPVNSNGTAWALYALCLAKDAQSKLREAILTLSTDSPTMDELNSIPYLDWVVREAVSNMSLQLTTAN